MTTTRAGHGAIAATGNQILTRGFQGLLEEALNGLGRLRAAPKPVIHPLPIEHEFNRLAARIIVAQDFHETPVASPLLIDDHDAIAALLLGSRSSQTYP